MSHKNVTGATSPPGERTEDHAFRPAGGPPHARRRADRVPLATDAAPAAGERSA